MLPSIWLRQYLGFQQLNPGLPICQLKYEKHFLYTIFQKLLHLWHYIIHNWSPYRKMCTINALISITINMRKRRPCSVLQFFFRVQELKKLHFALKSIYMIAVVFRNVWDCRCVHERVGASSMKHSNILQNLWGLYNVQLASIKQ